VSRRAARRILPRMFLAIAILYALWLLVALVVQETFVFPRFVTTVAPAVPDLPPHTRSLWIEPADGVRVEGWLMIPPESAAPGGTADARPSRGLLVTGLYGGPPDLAAVRGRRVAFVSRHSGSGFHAAVELLRRAGIEPLRDLAEVRFSGSHAASLELLEQGEVEVAAVHEGAIEGRDLRVLARSGPLPPDVLSASPSLPAEAREALRAALVGMAEDPAGREALAAMLEGAVVGFRPLGGEG